MKDMICNQCQPSETHACKAKSIHSQESGQLSPKETKTTES